MASRLRPGILPALAILGLGLGAEPLEPETVEEWSEGGRLAFDPMVDSIFPASLREENG
jgi:hypothetical protein